MSQLAVAAALLAGLSFAVGSVLQQREARQLPVTTTRGLVTTLVRRRLWLVGVAVAASAYGWQALALSQGPLALVQPLLVFELPFALVLAARLHRRRLSRRDIGAALLVAAGVATFLAVGAPRGGTDDASTGAWTALLVAAGGSILLLGLAAERVRGPIARTSLLAAAAALAFATMAPLLKATTQNLVQNGVDGLVTWQPWVMAVTALTGFSFSQRAFQSGSIAVSMPLLQAVQPLAAVGIGLTLFGEPIATAPAAIAGELLAAVVTVAGIVLLDTSPAVQATQEQGPAAAGPPIAGPVAPAPRYIDVSDSGSNASASSTGSAASSRERSSGGSAATLCAK